MKKFHTLTVILLCILMAPTPSQAKKPGKKMVKIPKGCFQMGTAEVHQYFDGFSKGIQRNSGPEPFQIAQR
jgi:formylglycine-generating enzyme required for sulfatase activity